MSSGERAFLVVGLLASCFSHRKLKQREKGFIGQELAWALEGPDSDCKSKGQCEEKRALLMGNVVAVEKANTDTDADSGVESASAAGASTPEEERTSTEPEERRALMASISSASILTPEKRIGTNLWKECESCECNRRRTEFLENWLQDRDALSFKDEKGRNKLMILVNDLRAESTLKSKLVKSAIKYITQKLSENPEMAGQFDSEDQNGNKTITYLIGAGMLDEAKEFASSFNCLKIEHDIGLFCPSLQEDGLSPVCLLAHQLKDRAVLDGLMGEFLALTPTGLSVRVDRGGNTLANVAVFSANQSLLGYVISNLKESLRTKNLEGADALSVSLRFMRHELTKRILAIKGLFDFCGKDKEYGREMLIYAACFANDEGVRLLLKNGASIGGKPGKRILKIVKKVANVGGDVAAATVDAVASYGSAYFMGTTLKIDIAKTAVDSMRRNFVPLNRSSFSISEEKEAAAISYVKDLIKNEKIENPASSAESREERGKNKCIATLMSKYISNYKKSHMKYLKDSTKSEEYLNCLGKIEEILAEYGKFRALFISLRGRVGDQKEVNIDMKALLIGMKSFCEQADELWKKEAK